MAASSMALSHSCSGVRELFKTRRYAGAAISLLAAAAGVCFVVFVSWFWLACGAVLLWLSPLYLATFLFALDSAFMAKDFLAGELALAGPQREPSGEPGCSQ